MKTRQPYKLKDKSMLILYIRAYIEKHGDFCDLNHLDVSSIDDMSSLFVNSRFNGDISKWNVSNVTDMSGMFYGSRFNGHISNWDVSNVKSMVNTFAYSKFTKCLSKWNINNDCKINGIFLGSKPPKDGIIFWYMALQNEIDVTSEMAAHIFLHQSIIQSFQLSPIAAARYLHLSYTDRHLVQEIISISDIINL